MAQRKSLDDLIKKNAVSADEAAAVAATVVQRSLSLSSTHTRPHRLRLPPRLSLLYLRLCLSLSLSGSLSPHADRKDLHRAGNDFWGIDIKIYNIDSKQIKKYGIEIYALTQTIFIGLETIFLTS